MKVAVVGSRSLSVDLSPYIPAYATAIISGGACGIDRCAAEYARQNGLELIEYLPDYNLYGKLAPLRRNDEIIRAADKVLVLWDGKSRGSKYVINQCIRLGKKIEVVMVKDRYMPRYS